MTELKEILPRGGKFKLKSTGNAEYELRPVSLDDYVWMEENFGGFEIFSKIYKGIELSSLCKIIYHFMTVDSKKYFRAIECETIDDEGHEKKIIVTGPERFRQQIMHLKEDIKSIIDALMMTMDLSLPEASKVEIEEIKKNGI